MKQKNSQLIKDIKKSEKNIVGGKEKYYFLYKKWNLLIFLNNLVISGFLVYNKKKLKFLRFDPNKFSFWVYSKKIKLQTKKILRLKHFFH